MKHVGMWLSSRNIMSLFPRGLGFIVILLNSSHNIQSVFYEDLELSDEFG